jgi:hypothetical protein
MTENSKNCFHNLVNEEAQIEAELDSLENEIDERQQDQKSMSPNKKKLVEDYAHIPPSENKANDYPAFNLTFLGKTVKSKRNRFDEEKTKGVDEEIKNENLSQQLNKAQSNAIGLTKKVTSKPPLNKQKGSKHF